MTDKTKSILEEAAEIVNGDRVKDYGDSNEMLDRISELWQPVLDNCVYLDTAGEPYIAMNPRHVALCLIQLKVAREVHAPKRDNAVDIAGYAEILGRASAAEIESAREDDRTHCDLMKVVDANAAIDDFISRGRMCGDEKERKELLGTFYREYMQHTNDDIVQPEHAERIMECLKEANGLLARDCSNVRMHFDPEFASTDHGVYLSWTEPKTDL